MTDTVRLDALELEPAPAPVVTHRRIVIDPAATPVFRPNDIRTVKAITGLSLMAMIDGDDDADKFCALAFFSLRREEPETLASTLWAQVEQADLEIEAARVDPTSGGTSRGSPPSASTTG
jgi:hypothetical protein